MNKNIAEEKTYLYERRLDPCQLAPCCAEHSRFQDDEGPCNDGRNGFINGRRHDDPKLREVQV